jgi:hypothetical protein
MDVIVHKYPGMHGQNPGFSRFPQAAIEETEVLLTPDEPLSDHYYDLGPPRAEADPAKRIWDPLGMTTSLSSFFLHAIKNRNHYDSRPLWYQYSDIQ